MITLVQQLFSITRCKASPVQLPYSLSALLLVVILNIFSHYLAFEGLELDDAERLVWASAMLISELAVLAGILWLRREEGRFIKLAIAFLGTHIIMSALLRVFVMFISDAQIIGTIGFLFAVWALVVKSYIFQEGFNVKPFKKHAVRRRI